MMKKYPLRKLAQALIIFSCATIFVCKKNNKNNNNNVVVDATPKKLGLYEVDSGEYRELIVAVSKIGTQSIDDGLVFDTGSGGMGMDAQGLITTSMVTK